MTVFSTKKSQKLEAKGALSVGGGDPIGKTQSSCLPCQYCIGEAHRPSKCSQAPVCPMCKTENHSSLHLPIVAEPSSQTYMRLKGYHSEDSSCGHPSVSKAKCDKL